MIFCSVKTRRVLGGNMKELPPGAAHYSYGHVYKKFTDLFDTGGLPFIEIDRPEIYSNYAFMKDSISIKGRPIHMIFKPFEEIRFLKGAYNIAHVAWEFDSLPDFDRLPAGHPARSSKLNDYRHMLSSCDEVFVGSHYSKTIIQNSGVKNVHIIPAPIHKCPEFTRSNWSKNRALEGLSNVKGMRAGRRIDGVNAPIPVRKIVSDISLNHKTVFITVCNPGDMRKNLPSMIDGFLRFSCGRKDVVLIIKMVIDGVSVKYHNVIDDLIPTRFSEQERDVPKSFGSNIFFVTDFLSEVELRNLYNVADFYICTSFAEGQNLPLQEAMASGAIAISPKTTAMADYVTDENAIVLKTEAVPLFHNAQTAYCLPNCSWGEVSADSLEKGLQTAISLSEAERNKKSAAGREMIEKTCGYKIVHQSLMSRIQAISL